MDLTFKTESGRFNYRVGAIIIRNNRLLMVKNEHSPYFYSVGGRVHLHETSESAVKREVLEETGMRLETDRIAFIHENLFCEDVTGEKFHEISFFYLMKDNPALDTICLSFDENGSKENLVWIPLDELKDTYLYPEFFKTELDRLSTELRHVVTNKEQTNA